MRQAMSSSSPYVTVREPNSTRGRAAASGCDVAKQIDDGGGGGVGVGQVRGGWVGGVCDGFGGCGGDAVEQGEKGVADLVELVRGVQGGIAVDAEGCAAVEGIAEHVDEQGEVGVLVDVDAE